MTNSRELKIWNYAGVATFAQTTPTMGRVGTTSHTT